MERENNHAPTVLGPCWPWQGYINDDGYGQVKTKTHRGKLAHRVSYESLIGPIPDRLTLDHLCRNRACVNPWHCEPVTRGENSRRGLKGFDFTGRCRSGKHDIKSDTDIYWSRNSDGVQRRGCRLCRNERERNRRKRLRESD